MDKRGIGELIANAVSHGIGVILGTSALIFLLIKAETPREIAGVAIFGSSMILLYLASTLFHAFPQSMRRVVAVFQRLDHCAIYLLIAGTYTPFILLLVPTPVGYTLLVLLWSCAFIGIVLKSIWIHRYKGVHLLMYLLMGWSIIFIWPQVRGVIPSAAMTWLILGGLSYTLGVLFYIRRFHYAHFVWHLFVLGGSMFHFVSIAHLI